MAASTTPAVALLLLLLLSACSQPAPEPAAAKAGAPAERASAAAEPALEGTGSCNTAAVGMCTETFGDRITAAEAKSFCVGSGQVYSPAACANAGSVGHCLSVAVAIPGSTVSVRTYFAADYFGGAPAAQKLCVDTMKGEWKAG